MGWKSGRAGSRGIASGRLCPARDRAAEPDRPPLPPPPPSPKLYYQVLNFGMIVSSALMIWKGLMVVTGSESPIVVVLR